jgi:hypothetical protein
MSSARVHLWPRIFGLSLCIHRLYAQDNSDNFFSQVMALVDLTICSVCLLEHEDPQRIYLAETSICYPALNKGEFI